MTTIEFTVHAIPVPQPRQRHRVAKMNGVHVAQNYLPKTEPVHAFKAAVQLAFASTYTGPPLTGPIVCAMSFVFPRPASMVWKKKPMPQTCHTKKPDIDNLQKSVLDALNKLAFVDDSQVCAIHSFKDYAAGGDQPRVQIRISQIDA